MPRYQIDSRKKQHYVQTGDITCKAQFLLEGITTTTRSHQFRDTLIKLNYYITNYNSFTACLAVLMASNFIALIQLPSMHISQLRSP